MKAQEQYYKALLARKAWWKKFWTDKLPLALFVCLLVALGLVAIYGVFSIVHHIDHKLSRHTLEIHKH